MNVELNAELVMAIRGYDCEEKGFRDDGIDFTASSEKSDEKILLRAITDPKSNSGILGVDVVRQMAETIEHENYDVGVLVGERFSEAARKETDRKGIQIFSEKLTQSFNPQKLYLTIQDCAEDLCKVKCGRVPEKESDCKGKTSDSDYSCRIRLISDNASFHFERGWTDLLRLDFMRLLKLRKSMGQ